MHAAYRLYCPACQSWHDPLTGILACPGARSGQKHGQVSGRENTQEHALIPVADPELFSTSAQALHTDDGLQPFAAFAPGFVFASVRKQTQYQDLLHGITQRLEYLEQEHLRATPLLRSPELASALGHAGQVWIKDETGAITGSHKIRHLLATMFYLEGLRHARGTDEKPPLAISSCGNAALAAAAAARAGGYTLRTFVPDNVHPLVEDMLRQRGAIVHKQCRMPGAPPGDPCYLAFRQAIERGHIPFSCSGADNWTNIEGGQTLGLELVLQCRAWNARLDHVIVQAGGGALGRSLVRALTMMQRAGMLSAMPRVHICQTEAGFPFVRAYLLALREVAADAGLPFDLDIPTPGSLSGPDARTGYAARRNKALRDFESRGQDQIGAVAAYLSEHFKSQSVRDWTGNLPRRKHDFMWPWDGIAPASLADGILDDETYDWYELLLGVLRSGGQAVIATEADIVRAKDLADQHTTIPVSATGAAGLAGLLALRRHGAIAASTNVGLLFTGLAR
jgi:threonine synthase